MGTGPHGVLIIELPLPKTSPRLEVAPTVSHVAGFEASTSNVLEPWVRDTRMEEWCSVLVLEAEGQLTSPRGSGMALAGGEV